MFPSAGAVLLPPLLARLKATIPGLTVTNRDGTTPGLLRALRAGTLDLALLTSRPPHRPAGGESPRLHIDAVGDTELLVAAPATGPFAARTTAHVDELAETPWIAAPPSDAEPQLGVWPGLPGRPRIAHTTSDWLTRLRLVACGAGVTTAPARMALVLPDGVRLLRVDGAPPEIRRILLARRRSGRGAALVALAFLLIGHEVQVTTDHGDPVAPAPASPSHALVGVLDHEHVLPEGGDVVRATPCGAGTPTPGLRPASASAPPPPTGTSPRPSRSWPHSPRTW